MPTLTFYDFVLAGFCIVENRDSTLSLRDSVFVKLWCAFALANLPALAQIYNQANRAFYFSSLREVGATSW